jgi:tetratricopeptide (TPR) repeat protein
MSELEIWNELGNIYYNSGAYDEAIRAYHKAIEMDHGNGQSFSNLGSIYVQKEFYAEAISMYQKGLDLLESAAEKALLWNRLGDVYLQMDDYSQALSAYQTAVELDPGNAALKIDLARVKQGAAVNLQLSETVNETVSVPPFLPETFDFETADADTAELDLVFPFLEKNEGESLTVDTSETDLIESTEEENPVFLSDEAPASPTETLAEELETEPALELTAEAVDDIEAEEISAQPQAEAGSDIESTVEENTAPVAEVDVTTKPIIVEDEPVIFAEETPLPPVSKQPARLELKMGGPINSRARALLKLGLLHWCRSDHEGALQFLRTALKLAAVFCDSRFEAVCFTAIARVETDRERIPEAIQAYESAVSLDPDNIFPWCSLGFLYSKADRYNEAVEAFKKAIQRDPQDSLSWNGLADVYAKLGRNEDAIAAYQLGNVVGGSIHDEDAIAMVQMASDSDGENPQILEEMGNINFTNGAFADAINDYSNAIELLDNATDKAHLWKRVGDAYQRLNKAEDANGAYQKAVELEPETIALQTNVARIELESDEVASQLHEETFAPIEQPVEEPMADSSPDEPLTSEEAEMVEAEPVAAEVEEKVMPPQVEEYASTPNSGPEPEAAYWFFKSKTPARLPARQPQPAPQPVGAFRLTAETGQGNVIPSPTFVLPHYASRAELDEQVLVDTLQDASVVVIEENGRTEKTSTGGYNGSSIPPSSDGEDNPHRNEPAPVEGSPVEKRAADEPVVPVSTPLPANNHTLEADIAAYRRVTEINPLNDRAWDALGNMYEAIGLHNEAISAFEKAISMASQREVYHYHLGLAHAAQKRYDKAILALQKVVALNPEYMLAHCALAGYYRRLGKEAEAKEHIAVARPYIATENDYNQACFESICGNIERALEFLQRALNNKQVKLDLIRNDPDLDFIRDDPRFEEMIAKVSTGRLHTL